MIVSSVLLVTYMAAGVSGQQSTDFSILDSATNTLLSIVGTVNSYNGPTIISQAATTSASTMQPTVTNVMYYNYYAQAAYCSDQLKTLNCVPCQYFKSDINAKGVAVFENKLLSTLAFVTVSDSRKEVTITFRGTAVNLQNYLLDATFFNVGFGNIKFHLGFFVATMSLYKDVIKAAGYQLQQHPTYKLVITGHSLGGAMARLTYFFIDINSQFPGITIELYTYGEPRVGNIAFADYFNNLNILSARCVNKNDVVPHVPPVSIIGTALIYDYYIHAQQELWIQIGGLIFCNKGFYEDPACSDINNPSYTVVDHNTYFDVSNANCSENVTPAPAPINPPAMPTKILNFADGAIYFLQGILSL